MGFRRFDFMGAGFSPATASNRRNLKQGFGFEVGFEFWMSAIFEFKPSGA